MAGKHHWESVYQSKRTDEVSWYRPHLDVSLALITRTAPDREARIIDVGGGAATLVDDLLAEAYRHVAVLDLSLTALESARARVGAADVQWLHGDVTTFPFAAASYDVWHDRAVFHFLTEEAQRRAYVAQVDRAVRPGGHVIVATFGPDGPVQCSGLDVVRYDAESLHDEFGERFELVDHQVEEHVTPAGRAQQFVYCLCRR